MLLKVMERLTILNILEPQGNMMTIALQRDIRKKVELSADKMKEVGLEQVGNQVHWKPENDTPEEITFSAAEMAHLQKIARNLDNNGGVTNETYETISLLLNGAAPAEPPKEK